MSNFSGWRRRESGVYYKWIGGNKYWLRQFWSGERNMWEVNRGGDLIAEVPKLYDAQNYAHSYADVAPE